MARRWWLLVALGSVLIGLPACSGSTTTSPSASTPPGTGATAADQPPSGPGGTAISLYFLRDSKVAAGQRQVAVTDDAPRTSVDLLLRGPTDVDQAAGLTTALRPTVQLRSLTVADGLATADFSRDLEDRDSQPGVAQVVYTLTQFPEIAKVKFLVDGLPNGAAGVLPYTRNDVPRITPDLLLESPTPGLVTPASVKVSGSIGAQFPSFDYRVEGPGGATVAQGTITTKFGTGARKKFDQVVDLPAGTAGPVTMVASAPPGSAQQEIRIPLVVQ